MDGNWQLVNSRGAGSRGRKRAGLAATARLGDEVKRLMEQQILPRRSRFNEVAEVWEQLLPVELIEHCSLVAIEDGVLKIQVDLPAYHHELRLCGPEFVRELQKQCPRARIKRMRVVLA